MPEALSAPMRTVPTRRGKPQTARAPAFTALGVKATQRLARAATSSGSSTAWSCS
jgi:hypothetical protein